MEMGIYTVHLHQPDFAEELRIQLKQTSPSYDNIEIGFT